MKNYDVIIVGGGSMGIAAAYYLQKHQQNVLVVEQSTIPNTIGSHHGATRILRMGYGNGGQYVPILKEALQLWKDLEKETSKELYHPVGALSLGHKNSTFVKETIESSLVHDLPHEQLTAAEMMDRYKGIRIPDDFVGCYDPLSGFLMSETCIKTYKEEAIKLGATVLENTAVTKINTVATHPVVETSSAIYETRKVIVTAGAWNGKLLADFELPMKPVRKTIGWYETDGQTYTNDFPVFVFDTLHDGHFYGFPDYDGKGLKIGRMEGGDTVNPDAMERVFTDQDSEELESFTSNYLPKVSSRRLDGKVCLFTNTPDDDFIVDFLNEQKNVIVAGGFSGHGFKFASVIGDILREMAIEGSTSRNIDYLKKSRF